VHCGLIAAGRAAGPDGLGGSGPDRIGGGRHRLVPHGGWTFGLVLTRRARVHRRG
jgi:hypothetical protein